MSVVLVACLPIKGLNFVQSLIRYMPVNYLRTFLFLFLGSGVAFGDGAYQHVHFERKK